MANNHQGSVEHAKLIIDRFSDLSKKYNISAGVKLQFRQLKSFIHKDYIDSDLKYVKRFKDTELSKEQFLEIANYIKEKNLVTIATPFDNESIPWLDDLDISVIKIASCSIDDWPLLEEICKINKRIIISTGGASFEHLRKVYDLFKKNNRDFAFMHCVGEYPTPVECSNMSRINKMKGEFPDIEIGLSTHESPKQKSLAPYAVSLGCTILEKHVGVETDNISLNAYSCTPGDMSKVIEEIKFFEKAFNGKSKTEKSTLQKLKRGIYVNREIKKDEIISPNDVYFSMPLQEDQLDASYIEKIKEGYVSRVDLKQDSPIRMRDLTASENEKTIAGIKKEVVKILKESKVHVGRKDTSEISAHYGLDVYNENGVCLIYTSDAADDS